MPFLDRLSRVRGAAVWAIVALAGASGCARRSRLIVVEAGVCTTSTAPETWRLEPNGVLRGRVVDLEGRPESGVAILIRPLGADSLSGEARIRTDADGGFTIGPQPPGRYRIDARRTGLGPYSDTVRLAEAEGDEPRIAMCHTILL